MQERNPQDPAASPYALGAVQRNNPYAPPVAVVGPPPVNRRSDTGGLPIWSFGNLLILQKRTELPHICVQSDAIDPLHRKRRKISWAPPWVPLLILAGLLPLIIVSLILTKRATIRYSISAEQNRRRQTAILVGWVIALAGIGIGIMSVLQISDPGNQFSDRGQFWLLFLLSILIALGGLIYGTHVALPFRPAKIVSDYVVLKGLNPDFVARFPAWPYQPL